MCRYRPVGAVVIALGLLLAACDSSGATTTTTDEVAASTSTSTAAVEAGPTPVIVDYSPTVSDVGGLMYLLAHPDVDVIAVSLPVTGEAGCDLGIEVTLGVLAMFDQEHVPVACDADVPDGARAWPEEFLAGHENLTFGLPESTATPSDLAAPDLIAKAAAGADRPVVLYAVAPLTNVATALERYPDLAGDLERIVIMGGAVDAPGNTFDANAEWNIWIDVPAAADVIASGVPVTLVPLDATNFVPVPSYYQRLLDEAEQSDAIVYLNTMVRTFPQVSSGFWYLWDELAAAVAAGEGHVSSEDMTIIVVEGGSDDGRTARDDGGYVATVAVAVPEPAAFYADFLGTLAGSPIEAGREATAEEEAYLEAVEAATSDLEATFEEAFSDPALSAAFFAEDGAYDATAVTAGVDRLLSAMVATHDAVADLEPPPSLQDVHDNFLEVFGMVVENKDETLTAAAQAETIDDFFATAPQLPDVNDACGPIADEATFLGVDVVIACNPQQ